MGKSYGKQQGGESTRGDDDRWRGHTLDQRSERRKMFRSVWDGDRYKVPGDIQDESVQET